MSQFKQLALAVNTQFTLMSEEELFVTATDRDEIVQVYLNAFPEGTNPVFRTNTEHDCSCCKHFIRSLGNVVRIVDGQVVTVWDVDAQLPHPYDVVALAMAEYVRSKPIRTVFRTKERQFGNEHTLELLESGSTHQWDHFWGVVASKHWSQGPEEHRSCVESARGVFERGLRTLSMDACQTVLDLIADKALYRGEEHERTVKDFMWMLAEFTALKTDEARVLFTWTHAMHPAARFRNTVIGTLIQDLSEGVEIEKAVKSFETKVAPTNYKRPKALITPRMIKDAVQTLNALDLEGAIERRFARIEDVSVNDVLWVDSDVRELMSDSIESLLMEEAAPPKDRQIDGAADISVDDFLSTIVPNATSLEVLVENRHLGNFVSLTAPVYEPGDARETFGLFKWDNDFAWTYDGDVTDGIKQRVKAAGGRIDARFRVSLGWYNFDDLDIHCVLPSGDKIYYGNKAGVLDVDMNAGSGSSRDAVENLVWDKLKDGVYKIIVNQYQRRESIDVGFEIDADLDGQVIKLTYPKGMRTGENVKVLTFTVKRGVVTQWGVGDNSVVIGAASQEKWGVQTEQLAPVDTVMLSPNHWGDNAVGNKHLLFMLRDCLNPDSARGIYNEFLSPKLEKHRKVFEVLGGKTKCPPSQDQLSGVGFSSTRGDEVVVVAKGPKMNLAYNVKM